MEKIKVKFLNFLKNNYKEILIVLFILLLGAVLRLYRIPEYMNFLGDEGRDMMIVRNLLVKGDLILIGPGTSVGNMYLGPLYYYLIAPALLLANFSPVGPAVLVALLGVSTIYITYLLTKKWFGIIPAIIASTLYAILPLTISYSNFSWNPNVLPFFSMLSVYSLYAAIEKRKYWLIIISFASFAFILQSHYMGIFLLPVLVAIWIFGLKKVNKKKKLITNTLIGSAVFLLLMSSLVIFDLRHNYMNLHALTAYLGSKEGTPFSLLLFTEKLVANFKIMIIDVLTVKNSIIAAVYSFVVLLGLMGIRLYHKNKFVSLLLVIWLLSAVLGLTLYGGRVISHYYGFAFSVIPIIIGVMIGKLIKRNKLTGVFVGFLLATPIVIYSYLGSTFQNPPNRQLQRAENVAVKIGKESAGERFNIAVIADSNYEDGYQYFLEKYNYSVIEIDPQNYDQTLTNQLFAVCELQQSKCDPTHSPKAQVASFGWSKIESMWEVDGTTLYKLIHSK